MRQGVPLTQAGSFTTAGTAPAVPAVAVPPTGDGSPLWLYAALLGMAMAALWRVKRRTAPEHAEQS